MNYNRPQISIEEQNLSDYYANRFDFLMISTFIISLIGVIFFYVLNKMQLYTITGSSLPEWVFDHSGTDGNWRIVFVVIFIGGQLLNYIGKSPKGIKFGSRRSPALSSNTSGVLIAISTFTFIFLISLPIFYLGGAKDSIYSIVLVTSCALSVALTKSLLTRKDIHRFSLHADLCFIR